VLEEEEETEAEEEEEEEEEENISYVVSSEDREGGGEGGEFKPTGRCAFQATWSPTTLASAQATSISPPTVAGARPTGRLSHSSCVVGKHLLVYGGSTAGGAELRSVQLLVSAHRHRIFVYAFIGHRTHHCRNYCCYRTCTGHSKAPPKELLLLQVQVQEAAPHQQQAAASCACSKPPWAIDRHSSSTTLYPRGGLQRIGWDKGHSLLAEAGAFIR
jgi:hypothetical protein